MNNRIKHKAFIASKSTLKQSRLKQDIAKRKAIKKARKLARELKRQA